jgi:NADH-quinone oxidoreductase subunit E
MARTLSTQTLADIEGFCSRYPSRLAALLPSLHLVQKEHGYISREAELDVAEQLGVPATRVREVVSFYTMFHDAPTGRHVVKICRNLPCQMRGADKLMARAKALLDIDFDETTPDGRVTLAHEECLASCGTGPMLWYNGTLVENLTEDGLQTFLEGLT